MKENSTKGEIILTVRIAPDKTLCSCFRQLFKPNVDIRFDPAKDIFFVEEDTSKAQRAFVCITPENNQHLKVFSTGKCKRSLTIPLYLLVITDDQKRILCDQYHVPGSCFIKKHIAVHVEPSDDEEELQTAELVNEDFLMN